MQKKFVGNLALLIFINILIKPFWVLGIDRSVQNIVGSAEYGVYYALFNFSFLFSIILDAGITSFNNKNIAQHRQLLGKYFSNMLILKAVLSLVYVGITLLAAFILGYSGIAWKFLWLLVINQVLSSLILYLRSNLSALHLFTTDSLLSALDKLLMIALILPLLYGNILPGPFRIEWFIYVQSIAYLITALIVLIIVLLKTGRLRFNLNIPLLLLILRQTYPYALLVILMTLYNKVDSVMIERMLPDGAMQVGIYASAYRLLDAVNMIAFLFATLLLPMFASMIRKKESVNELVKLSFSLLMIPSIILVISCCMFNIEIMQMLNNEANEYSATIFALLMISYLAIANTYIFGTLLTANDDMRFLNTVALVCLVINIVLNIFLIPSMKAMGATIATLITQALVTAFHVYRSYDRVKVALPLGYVVRLLVFIPALLGITHLFHAGVDNWMLAFSLSMFTGLIAGVLMKIIPLRAIFKLFASQ